MSLKKTNLHIGLVVKLICCFRGIIARRIVRRRIGVGVESLAGHSRRIKRRRIFPVVPVIGVLLLWLLIRLESIRVVIVGLGDLLWTVGGSNPSGLRWRRRRRIGGRVVDWLLEGNCWSIGVESSSRLDLE